MAVLNMLRLSRKQTWGLANITLGAALATGTIFDIVLIQWLIIGFVWAMLGAYVSVLVNKERRASCAERGHPINTSARWIVDTIFFGTFVSMGWYFTAGAYMTSCILLEAIYDPEVHDS